MRPFGLVHFSILAITALVAVWLSILCRNNRISTRTVRYTLAISLIVQETIRYAYFGFRFPNDLPIHLCTLITWMVVWACFTLHPLAVEFVYFTGIVGAGMAMVTPDLPKDVITNWPSYPGIRYFMEHACILIAIGVLVFGGIAPIRPGAIWRTNAQVAVYAALLGVFNWWNGTNYMFLCAKPKNPSLLDFMGPWPYYLLSSEVLCLFLFWLLWLPIRPNAAAAATRPAGSPSAGIVTGGTQEAIPPSA
ncbi:MAG: TIGR02206 family membrane protein [Bryobacterales bacterium]|nr:TIGR02206 family membrane protein [Bryobacterales bacterium]